MKYDRMIMGYHGCDKAVAERLLEGDAFKPSDNDYDWLGHGIYFWEFGPARAHEFAQFQYQRRSKNDPTSVTEPSAVGAVLQLGNCFDLMDTRNTRALVDAYPLYETWASTKKEPLPVNGGQDLVLRRADCAYLNWYLQQAMEEGDVYNSVRGAFIEGSPIFPGSGIAVENHIQICIRTPACVVGVFKPR